MADWKFPCWKNWLTTRNISKRFLQLVIYLAFDFKYSMSFSFSDRSRSRSWLACRLSICLRNHWMNWFLVLNISLSNQDKLTCSSASVWDSRSGVGNTRAVKFTAIRPDSLNGARTVGSELVQSIWWIKFHFNWEKYRLPETGLLIGSSLKIVFSLVCSLFDVSSVDSSTIGFT